MTVDENASSGWLGWHVLGCWKGQGDGKVLFYYIITIICMIEMVMRVHPIRILLTHSIVHFSHNIMRRFAIDHANWIYFPLPFSPSQSISALTLTFYASNDLRGIASNDSSFSLDLAYI